MKDFFKEYRRTSAKDLPKEIHMGWSLVEKCGECSHPLGLKAKPVGLDKGIFTKYCTGCNQEFEQIELEGDELVEFSLEVADRLMGGAA
jgi:hypothetical protein